MIEPIIDIGNITTSASSSYKTLTSVPAEYSRLDAGKDISKSSSRYIVENNTIVFERYDRYGKLVTKVPWNAYTLSEKA
jgi:hypothetical protein